MKRSFFALSAILFTSLSSVAQTSRPTVPSAEAQIRSALMAAPEAKREGAGVYGYNEKMEIILLKKGTNELICIADDPERNGFSASCFHSGLEAFMVRGWDLKKSGKSFQEIFEIREEEVKSGKLKIPDKSTLFVFSAPEEKYNKQTGEVTGGNFRYVIYIPYATTESTGLPLSPEAPGMPWIMDPGTHRAHIMINPPENK